MALPLTLLLLNILNFITAIIVIGLVFSIRKHPSIRWMLSLVSALCIVSFCTLGVYISKNFDIQSLFVQMRFLGLGLLAPSWLLFIISVYGPWRWAKKNLFAFIVFLPGLITTILTIIPYSRNLVVHNFSPIDVHGFSVLTYENGVWFPFHYKWAMLLVLASMLLGIYFFIKERGNKRWQIFLLTLCSLSAAGIDIYCVLTNSPYRWLLLSSATFLFSQLGIIFSTWKLGLLNIVPLAMGRVFQDFPAPIFILDRDQIIRSANKSAKLFFNLKNSQGSYFKDLLPQIPLEDGEISLKSPTNEFRSFSLILEKIESNEGNIFGHIIFFKEITLQKSIEKKLNENLEFKARLLSLISHDLAGHIESQTLLMSHLQDELDEGPIKERVSLISSSTFASQGFIANILSWVQGQENHFELVRKSFEWNILIKEMIEELEYSWRLKKINIKFESSNSLLIGEGDSNMLQSVIRNLLSNAIRASSNNSQISILLNSDNDFVEVVLSDEGIGISDEQLKDLLKETSEFSFSQTSGFKSYGIGLKIVQYFLKMHKGHFSIQSQLGLGTKVSFRLPLS